MGLEPTTATLARWRSTTELRSLLKLSHTIPHPPPYATLFFARCFHPQNTPPQPDDPPPNPDSRTLPPECRNLVQPRRILPPLDRNARAALRTARLLDFARPRHRLPPRNQPRPPCSHDHGRPFPPHTIQPKPSTPFHAFPFIPTRPCPVPSTPENVGGERTCMARSERVGSTCSAIAGVCYGRLQEQDIVLQHETNKPWQEKR